MAGSPIWWSQHARDRLAQRFRLEPGLAVAEIDEILLRGEFIADDARVHGPGRKRVRLRFRGEELGLVIDASTPGQMIVCTVIHTQHRWRNHRGQRSA